MAKYKVYTDRPKISEEDAQKNMNFDFVLKSQKKAYSPLYLLQHIFKKPKLMRKIILILIVLMTLLFTMLDDTTATQSEQEEIETSSNK